MGISGGTRRSPLQDRIDTLQKVVLSHTDRIRQLESDLQEAQELLVAISRKLDQEGILLD